MMRSLTFKLTLVVLIASLVGVALVAIFAQRVTTREFGRFVISQAQTDFVRRVTEHYRRHGSWQGVRESLRPRGREGNSVVPQPNQPPEVLFILLNQSGCVITPAPGYQIGDCLDTEKREQGQPIKVKGKKVGIVLRVGRIPPLGPYERAYLQATNQALFNGAVGAAFLALILGIILARRLTRPLQELTEAIRAMQRGELKQEVEIRSQDELGELAEAFNQTSTELARANQLRRQMTADIAHDLRNPLVVITGYIESMRDGILKPTRARLDTMYEEAMHLQRLVTDLRILSLADAGELSLIPQTVSPHELLERAASAYQNRAEQKGIDLQMEVEPDIPEIEVDPERMAQVLSNLVSNALRHTPEKGQIILSAQHNADYVQMAVQDNGEGIAPEALPRIFDRFYRVDPARTHTSGESGLGLAIAKSIMTAHNGTITVESTPGISTRFTVAVPI